MALTEGKWKGGNGVVKKSASKLSPIKPPPAPKPKA